MTTHAERTAEKHGEESYIAVGAVLLGKRLATVDHDPCKVKLAECGDHVTMSAALCGDLTSGLLMSMTFNHARALIRDLRKVLYEAGQGEN